MLPEYSNEQKYAIDSKKYEEKAAEKVEMLHRMIEQI